MPIQGFLREVGLRLRAAREAAGLGVTETATAAGVSRRHLTEAEAGRANPSLAVLARLAGALRVPLAGLVDVPLRPRTERVALLGLRGAGKTTVGRLLAREIEAPFVELDRRVEEHAGLSLAEIFDLEGPDAFHRFEAEALERILAQGERSVIATGGSVVAHPPTFERLRETCRTVWLRAAPEEHFRRVWEQGDRRPMRDRPRAMDELRALLARREPAYARSELVVETSGRAPEDVVRETLSRLRGGAPPAPGASWPAGGPVRLRESGSRAGARGPLRPADGPRSRPRGPSTGPKTPDQGEPRGFLDPS